MRLNDELSQQIAETHAAVNAAKQSEEENAALRIRVSGAALAVQQLHCPWPLVLRILLFILC